MSIGFMMPLRLRFGIDCRANKCGPQVLDEQKKKTQERSQTAAA
jgi:hypothetical protein